jgi:hypothetical protein
MSDEQVIYAIQTSNSEVARQVTQVVVSTERSNTLLRQILEFFPKLIQTIADNIRRISNTQAQIAIISKATEIETYQVLISNQNELIEKRKSAYENDIHRLNNTYQKLNKETKNNFENLVNNLDGHVININKNYFESKAKNSFEKKAAPSLNALDKYYYDCSFLRSTLFKDLIFKINSKINEFLNDRKNFIAFTKKFVIDRPQAEVRSCAVPLYFTEDVNGESELIFPGKLETFSTSIKSLFSKNSLDKNYIEINQLKISELLKKEIKDLDKLREDIIWKDISQTDKEKMHVDLDVLFGESVLSGNNNIRTELHKAIDNLDITIGSKI